MKDTKKTKEQLIAELVESEEKYRILVEFASDCIHIETIEGRILECNIAGAKMFGYTKEEMTHVSISKSKEEREKVGITDSLIRVSVGIENVTDLIEDIDNSFKGIT